MITINIPTAQEFWKAVALFAYRRWAIPGQPKPVGIPNNRDPQHPCEAYEPRRPHLNDWADCQTDGHYLCDKCCHKAPPDEDEIEEGEQEQC